MKKRKVVRVIFCCLITVLISGCATMSPEVDRSLIGVQIHPELAQSFGLKDRQGAFVTFVEKDDPADKAGIKARDIIVEFDGKEIKEVNDLSKTVAATPPGKTVKVKIIRDGKEKLLTVTIGKLSESPQWTGYATPGPLLPGQTDGNFTVAVDSIAAHGAALKGITYIIVSGMKDVSDNDLQFKEFARFIENALSQRGYKRVSVNENADLLIRLAYGIGEPQTIAYTKTYTTSTGYSYPVGQMWFTVPPQKEQTTIKETTYKRTLILDAYDLKDTDKHSQLWKTTVKSEGTMSDLRTVLPFMITAAVSYFGVDTIGQKEINLSGRDKRVLDIRK